MFSLPFSLCLSLANSIIKLHPHILSYIHTYSHTFTIVSTAKLSQLQNGDRHRHAPATEAASPATETTHHRQNKAPGNQQSQPGINQAPKLESSNKHRAQLPCSWLLLWSSHLPSFSQISTSNTNQRLLLAHYGTSH